MKTLTRVSTVYPAVFKGNAITPLYGRSFAPVIECGKMPQPEWMFWELYNLASYRTEQKNLAAEEMEMVRELATAWKEWAETHYVLPRFLGTAGKKRPSPVSNLEP